MPAELFSLTLLEGDDDIAQRERERAWGAAEAIITEGNLGEFSEALRIKRLLEGLESPAEAAAWCPLEFNGSSENLLIGSLAMNDKGYSELQGAQTYYPPLHITPLSRAAEQLVNDRGAYYSAASSEDYHQATRTAMRGMYEQEGRFREFEGFLTFRFGGSLFMGPDTLQSRQALATAGFREQDRDTPYPVPMPFHPSFERPVTEYRFGGNLSYRKRPEWSGMLNYWDDREREAALATEAERLLADREVLQAIATVAPVATAQTEAIVAAFEAPQAVPLTPFSEATVAMRALEHLASRVAELNIDIQFLNTTYEIARQRLGVVFADWHEKAQHNSWMPSEIPGVEGAADVTQQFGAQTEVFGPAGTQLISTGRSGDTKVFGGPHDGEEAVPTGEVPDFSPTQKQLVHLALQKLVADGDEVMRLYAADVLANGQHTL